MPELITTTSLAKPDYSWCSCNLSRSASAPANDPAPNRNAVGGCCQLGSFQACSPFSSSSGTLPSLDAMTTSDGGRNSAMSWKATPFILSFRYDAGTIATPIPSDAKPNASVNEVASMIPGMSISCWTSHKRRRCSVGGTMTRC